MLENVGDTGASEENQINQNNQRTNQKIENTKRRDIIRMVMEQGYSAKSVADILDLSASSVRNVIAVFKNQQRCDRKPKGGQRNFKVTEHIANRIEDLISENPRITLKAIKGKLMEQENVILSTSTIDNILKKLKITLKKTHRELDRVNNEQTINVRKEFCLWYNEHNLGGNNMLFIDESSFNLHISRSQGRSYMGTRVNTQAPTVRGRSVTLISCISETGLLFSKVISNSTVTGNLFSLFFEELCTHLRDVLKLENVWLLLDNAKIHRRSSIAEICGRYGFSFNFLSPYSYMLNPIENCFSKIKCIVRGRLAENTNMNLQDIIYDACNLITLEDCQGFYRYVNRNMVRCAAGLPYIHQ
ncbi:hypothetical protein CDIK_4146 [Cucumispora dikerogammari]|nr:hypothetical protein CDIK_4146 [Cucumispora dikerogammari]